ncbi:hypothetical protein GCM10009525_84110 [Streptosporangium amethystogenes subsp. fukuiense]
MAQPATGQSAAELSEPVSVRIPNAVPPSTTATAATISKVILVRPPDLSSSSGHVTDGSDSDVHPEPRKPVWGSVTIDSSGRSRRPIGSSR